MKLLRHVLTGALALVAVALAIGACDDGQYGYDYGYGPNVACGQFTSCDTCTPIQGCGWCYTGNGTGTCTDGPQDCSMEPGGGWTWDPSGCRVGAEAGTSGPGPDAAAARDGEGDATEDAAGDAPSDVGSRDGAAEASP